LWFEDEHMSDEVSRQYLLYDAATRWNSPPLFRGAGEVIDAAANCLVDGIDTPSLRLLAGASPNDPTEELRDLVDATLNELGLPQPGELPGMKVIGANGLVLTRIPRDTVRFEVRSTEPDLAGHELLVYVNDVEMTRLGAGLGMDPFDVLIPDNRLVATSTPTQIGIARCDCGEYGCGSTDVVIVRDGNAVHWDWKFEAPIRGGVTFKADEYDAEVARIGADHSWERPEDTTARLVLTSVNRDRLTASGLRLDWVAKDHANPDLFKAALYYGDSDWQSEQPGYQIFIRISRIGRSPEVVAAEMVAMLATEPGRWNATWHAVKPRTTAAPDIASRRWRHEGIRIGADVPPKPKGLKRLWKR